MVTLTPALRTTTLLGAVGWVILAVPMSALLGVWGAAACLVVSGIAIRIQHARVVVIGPVVHVVNPLRRYNFMSTDVESCSWCHAQMIAVPLIAFRFSYFSYRVPVLTIADGRSVSVWVLGSSTTTTGRRVDFPAGAVEAVRHRICGYQSDENW